ncbi:MAG: hypothetical protein JF615_07015 [Asticcacaulis sp.]|nr:hypothetical protein [Asticcacaulis sp.]
MPDHPPAQFHWRGEGYRVVRADGPERIFGEWWRREREVCAMRDYFRVEDETGRRFWIFRSGCHEDRDGDDAWYLHGFFA